MALAKVMMWKCKEGVRYIKYSWGRLVWLEWLDVVELEKRELGNLGFYLRDWAGIIIETRNTKDKKC
jgi:hypothetical protein